MTHGAVIGLLIAGCVCQVVCVAGVMWMRSGFDQLHYSGAASTVGLVFFGVAAALQGFDSVSGTIECLVALGLVFLLGPVMTTAPARARRRTRFAPLEPFEQEFGQQQ